MTDLYEHFTDPLNDTMLVAWHKHLLSGDKFIRTIGAYRTHDEPMQVVSRPIHKPTIHFETPPPKAVSTEMQRFIAWFNNTSPLGKASLPTLTRAVLVYLYFVCIYPFEDGNGRIGRALDGKSLAQNLGHHSLIALAHTIERKRKDYYAALERNNENMEVTDCCDISLRPSSKPSPRRLGALTLTCKGKVLPAPARPA
jgi:Fic family protein